MTSNCKGVLSVQYKRVLDKVVADGSVVHPERCARMLKMHFTEPIPFGFFWFFNEQTVRA
jgi:hypothetical protein